MPESWRSNGRRSPINVFSRVPRRLRRGQPDREKNRTDFTRKRNTRLQRRSRIPYGSTVARTRLNRCPQTGRGCGGSRYDGHSPECHSSAVRQFYPPWHDAYWRGSQSLRSADQLDSNLEVQSAHLGRPDVIITADTATWIKVVAGDESIYEAIFLRKVRVKGDMRLFRAFRTFFP
jgi:hypothetical protein